MHECDAIKLRHLTLLFRRRFDDAIASMQQPDVKAHLANVEDRDNHLLHIMRAFLEHERDPWPLALVKEWTAHHIAIGDYNPLYAGVGDGAPHGFVTGEMLCHADDFDAAFEALNIQW